MTKSFAYDNNSLVTFYSIKNSMISGKRDFIFAELAQLLEVFSVIPSFHNVIGDTFFY